MTAEKLNFKTSNYITLKQLSALYKCRNTEGAVMNGQSRSTTTLVE
jgi:hypothetical protein